MGLFIYLMLGLHGTSVGGGEEGEGGGGGESNNGLEVREFNISDACCIPMEEVEKNPGSRVHRHIALFCTAAESNLLLKGQ